MQALKTAAFLRPASRPSSPAPIPPPSRPDSGVPFERVSRPLTKLSLTNFKRGSTPVSTPPITPPIPVTLVQDGSYLEALGLKLSEASSKALAHPAVLGANPNELLGGRRPIPAGRGRAFGALIAAELNACRSNPHLYRAIVRLLLRPLSVLLTNLSSQLLPLLSSPAFLVPPAPSVQAPNPNPTQAHALALATFAGELLETFDELGLGMDADPRGDGLKTTREGLVSVVGRVVNPLVAGIKRELTPLIEALEAPVSAPPTTAPATKTATTSAKILHPSIASLQTLMPVYARALARYTASQASQAALATLLISLIWRGLVALSHRPIPAPQTQPLPPSGTALSASNTFIRRLNSGPATPPTTPPPSRFALKLPPSRPPSPPIATVPSSADDARSLYDLLQLLPRPSQGSPANRLAREAVDDAFEGLAALTALLDALTVSTPGGVDAQKDLDVLTADLPALTALPVLLRAYAGCPPERSVPAILGLSEGEYRETCLAGFGRAEDCAPVVCERVLGVLLAERHESAVVSWLDTLRAAGA